MKVRKFEEKDLKSVSKLFDEYRVFYERKSDLDASEKFISERFKNNESEIFIAENNGNEIVGFTQLYPIFSSTQMKRIWLLNDLYVDEKFRGKGFSKKLMEIAKKFCKESGAYGITLETAKTNFVGNILYPKVDFELDLEHNYYFWKSK